MAKYNVNMMTDNEIVEAFNSEMHSKVSLLIECIDDILNNMKQLPFIEQELICEGIAIKESWIDIAKYIKQCNIKDFKVGIDRLKSDLMKIE